jgi:hypothetical protein
MRVKRPNFEEDETTFPAEAYTVDGYRDVAWHVYGWETEPDEDTEWSGYEVRTGRVVAVMIGDDRRFTFDPSELTPLEREDYCGECGQIGCAHDGLDRSE